MGSRGSRRSSRSDSMAPRPFWSSENIAAKPPMEPATRPVISKKERKCPLARPPAAIRSAPLKMTSVMAPKMKRMMNDENAPRHTAPRRASVRMRDVRSAYRACSRASFAKALTPTMPVRASATTVFDSATSSWVRFASRLMKRPNPMAARIMTGKVTSINRVRVTEK